MALQQCAIHVFRSTHGAERGPFSIVLHLDEQQVTRDEQRDIHSHIRGRVAASSNAFKRLRRQQLLTTHADKYVAVHEGQMINSDSDDIVLIQRVHKRIISVM